MIEKIAEITFTYSPSIANNVIKLFQFFGGDTYLYPLIKNLLNDHHVVEVFGGSGVVSLNYSKAIAWNDVDKRLYDIFFYVKHYPNEFCKFLEEVWNEYDFGETLADREKVKAFLKTIKKYENPIKNAAYIYLRYVVSLKPFDSAPWLSVASNRVKRLRNLIRKIRQAHNALKRIEIYNHDFEIIFDMYAHSEVCLYCDPPWFCYEFTTSYGKLMSLHDFKRFFLKIKHAPNPILIKHRYDMRFLNHLDKTGDWYLIVINAKASTTKTQTKWMFASNYKPNLTKSTSLTSYLFD